jgi:maltose/moltooligosaccharide transporter
MGERRVASIAPLTEKPRQSWAGLASISFGFFGIQIGFGLQNANMSRIFETLGAPMDDLPALWVAAPLTGLLVQPLVGYFSDRTWGSFGRRRPYFMAGAILAGLSLLFMPLAPVLLAAAMMLWVLDASLNISMEPFRAFVGDMVRSDQHTAGYAVQTAFIGAGAVVGSAFPWFLDWVGVSNVAPEGSIPDTVKFSFWFGAVALIAAVSWTVFSTQEYSPEEMRAFGQEPEAEGNTIRALASRTPTTSLLWIVAGIIVVLGVWRFDLEKEVYLLGGLLASYGVLSLVAISQAKGGGGNNILGSIVGDFAGMPPIMKRLALVQFFSWSALFIMWINTTSVVAQYFYGTAPGDSSSATFNEAGNWVGVLFAIYNGVAALAALFVLKPLADRIGRVKTHMVGLSCGALGYLCFFLLRDPAHLWIAEIGVGIAWASILAMPYAILASALPQSKLGIYMGLFNVFIVVPQLLVATVMGSIMKAFFPTEPIWTMAFAAGAMLLAAFSMLWVKEPDATN